MSSFFRHTLIAWCWLIVVFIIHAIPGKDLPDLDIWDRLGLDKFIHLLCFLMLCLFFCIGFKKQQTSSLLRRNAWKIALVGSILFGGLMEIMQSTLFVDRFADWLDFAANSIGAIFGVVIFRIIYGKELSLG